MTWEIKHKSGTVLFRTDNIETARDRERAGWWVVNVKYQELTSKALECEQSKLFKQAAKAWSSAAGVARNPLNVNWCEARAEACKKKCR